MSGLIGVEQEALVRELSEALADLLADRPQRCGHSSDPMCCPYENFPTLAAFFGPDDDALICGVDEGYGRCGRPAGHTGSLHAVSIGGGSDPSSDPAVWFVFGDVEKPTYRVLSLNTAQVFDPDDYPPAQDRP
jgi:hypothetical protein